MPREREGDLHEASDSDKYHSHEYTEKGLAAEFFRIAEETGRMIVNFPSHSNDGRYDDQDLMRLASVIRRQVFSRACETLKLSEDARDYALNQEG